MEQLVVQDFSEPKLSFYEDFADQHPDHLCLQAYNSFAVDEFYSSYLQIKLKNNRHWDKTIHIIKVDIATEFHQLYNAETVLRQSW